MLFWSYDKQGLLKFIFDVWTPQEWVPKGDNVCSVNQVTKKHLKDLANNSLSIAMWHLNIYKRCKPVCFNIVIYYKRVSKDVLIAMIFS